MTSLHSEFWPDPKAVQVFELLPRLRPLAARLVTDEDLAEEIALEVATSTVKRSGIRDRVHYASAALRRKALEYRRREGRRKYHEAVRAAASETSTEGPDDVAERVELMGTVLEEIRRLPAVQGRVLGLRYLDEVPVDQIAAREGVTPSTVRSHLSRGLATVRKRLDQRYKGRASWSLVLAPWALDPQQLMLASGAGAGGATPTFVGASGGASWIMMTLQWTLGLGTLAALGFWLTTTPADTDSDLTALAPPLLETPAPKPDEAVAESATARSSAAESPPERAPQEPSPPKRHPVKGRVVAKADSTGIPGVKLTIVSADPADKAQIWSAQTDSQGQFQVPDVTVGDAGVVVTLYDPLTFAVLQLPSSHLIFPLDGPLAVDCAPTLHFDFRGEPVPEEAEVQVAPANSPLISEVVNRSDSPWVRFQRFRPTPGCLLTLEAPQNNLLGSVRIPEGERPFADPLVVSFALVDAPPEKTTPDPQLVSGAQGTTFAQVLLDATQLEQPDPQQWSCWAFQETDLTHSVQAEISAAGGPGLWHASFEELGAGPWRAEVRVGKEIVASPRHLDLEPGGITGPVILRPAAQPRTVAVRVLDPVTRAPIPGARLWALQGTDERPLQNNQQGVFPVVELPSEQASSIFADAPGYRLQEWVFEPSNSSDAIDMVLERGWRGRVKVLDVVTTGPAAGIPVHVDGELRGRTDATGVLWFEASSPPESIEVARYLEDCEVVFDPYAAGVSASGAKPGQYFAVRRR